MSELASNAPGHPRGLFRSLAAGALAGVLLAVPFHAPVARAADGAEIGTTVVAVRQVTGTLGENRRRLREGVRVHLAEVLETAANGRAELQLDDDTKLALGPNGRLSLDDYVVQRSQGIASVTLRVLKGAFRFITGENDKNAYRIETPSATIGVLGTVFDLFVDENGETVVLLHEGEVEVCSRARNCRRHNLVGQLVHSRLDGIVTEPIRWTKGLLPGVAVATAFPFVGRSLRIDPIRRLRHAAILNGTAGRATRAATRATRQGTRAVRRGVNRAGRTLRRLSPF
ncbi:MAG: hypothetical protein GC150_04925 [Rhizobiales bacterium]|nr:hypothetical protein [Hyphomicrobiales bacterium]